MSSLFPNLFSPFQMKGLEIRNRIFSSGHDTDLARGGIPTDELIAYHVARARGGVGLIVVQVVAVHDSARYTSEVLQGADDDCIPHFSRLFDAIHREGAAAFVQLFHPGRELAARRDGAVMPAWGVSQAPSERFKVVAKTMSTDEIGEIISGYGDAARRMAAAGVDGVEIVGSHGYLPSQFLSPSINFRTDEYGGNPENRRRFVDEVIQSIRSTCPEELIVGARLSGDEFDSGGLDEDAMFEICRNLAPSLDYLNVIAGTSASSGGSVHIVPPMTVSNGYMAPFSAKLKQAVGPTAVLVAGRINQPQDAEKIVREGAADMCGMTRAMICDPRMPAKASLGQVDDIRACIGCNQACIGHAQLGLPISCIQYPESGRELRFAEKPRAEVSRRVLVVGGGPAGMKAAITAAETGNSVTLWERSSRLGGQALLAQALPNREEFGGIINNLEGELRRAGVSVSLNSEFDQPNCSEFSPDAVVLATGSRRWMPPIEGGEGVEILHHEDILAGAKTGQRVVIYDWRTDWIAIGMAELLSQSGADVRLAVNGVCPGFAIQNYVRDAAIARLYRLGVETTAFMRLYGAEDRTVYFVHTAAQEPVVLEDVDTLVVVPPNQPEVGPADWLKSSGIPYRIIGDALAPRTAEEAVYEGLTATLELLT
ncbi:MAG: FAD-dependent oxidoreductase [Rhodospirillaceae bacterium]|nr:FAD-dependent oxidoreductase [Rhodospirillaceae bacterium]